MSNFKNHMLNENASQLGDRVGDVLNSVHQLQSDYPQLGIRQSVRISTSIANQIRKIINDEWGENNSSILTSLQKCGISLLKGSETKTDLKEVVDNVAIELENCMEKLNVPINNLADPEEE